MPRGGGTVELQLTIRYHGLKATQYFSKFTEESRNVFKDDLLVLKLPHPKKDNITFVSHGCVQCVWPTAEVDGILHKHIVHKTRLQSVVLQRELKDTLHQLSITTLTVNETYAKGKKPSSWKIHSESDWERAESLAKLAKSANGNDDNHMRPQKRARIGDDAPSFECSAPPTSMHINVNSAASGSNLTPQEPLQSPVLRYHSLSGGMSVLTGQKAPSAPILGASFEHALRHSFDESLRGIKRNLDGTPVHAVPQKTQTLTASKQLPTMSIPVMVPRRTPTNRPVGPLLPAAQNQNPIPNAQVMSSNTLSHQSQPPPPPFQFPPTSVPRRTSRFSDTIGALPTPKNPAQYALPTPPPSAPSTSPASQFNSGKVSSSIRTDTTTVACNNTVGPRPQPPQQSEVASTPTPARSTPSKPTQLPTAVVESTNPRSQTSVEPKRIAPTRTLRSTPAPRVSLATLQQSAPSPSSDNAERTYIVTAATALGLPAPGIAQPSSLARKPLSRPASAQLSHLNPPTRTNSSAKSKRSLAAPAISAAPSPASQAATPPIRPKSFSERRCGPFPAPSVSIAPLQDETPSKSSSGPEKTPAASRAPSDPPASPKVYIDRACGTSPPAEDMSSKYNPNRESVPTAMQRLTREACDIKRQITANIAREASVIDELKRLKASWIPAPTKLESEEPKSTVTALELASIQRRLQQVEEELATEKRLRREAQDAIADIRRECKKPFVVPSLLDAFVELSRLTTVATVAAKARQASLSADTENVVSALRPADIPQVHSETPRSAVAAVSSSDNVKKEPSWD